MDVKIVWSEETVGYGVVYFSGYRQSIIYLLNESEDENVLWGWAKGDLAFDGFKTKALAQADAEAYFTNGRSNFYDKYYGIKK